MGKLQKLSGYLPDGYRNQVNISILTMNLFRVSNVGINPDELKSELRAESCGGFVCFEGWVRNHHEGRKVESLSYTTYQELAEKEGQLVVEEALEKFEVEQAVCVHRIGKLSIGEMAVWVGVSAPHREAAFEACQYIIDKVKSRVPVWKEEAYVDGSRDWVACHCGGEQY